MVLAAIDITAMTDLVAKLQTALEDLPGHKSSLSGTMNRVGVDPGPASGLDKVIAWGNGELPGLRRRLALAVAIESKHPSFGQAVPIEENDLPTDTPAVAAQKGKEAAADLLAADGEIDQDLLDRITAGQNDPYFAQAFASATTPEQLSHVAIRMSDQLRNMGDTTQEQRDTWQKKYDQVLSAVGTTIGTATRNGGDLALPSDYADRWLKTITERPYDPDQDYGDKNAPNAELGQGGAAAQFLRYGVWSTPVLNHISDGVYDYERSTNENQMWWKRSTGSDGYFHGAYNGNPLPPEGQKPEDWKGQSGLNGHDPLAAILAGLGNNADAAQHFLGDQSKTTKTDLNGNQVEVSDKLKYLLQDRVWPSDDGEGLGAALVAATTTFRDRTGKGQLSAQIAGQSFALLGDRTGDGKSDGLPDGVPIFGGAGAKAGWQMYKGMRDDVATMLASYGPDLIHLATSKEEPIAPGTWTTASNDMFPPDGPYGAAMDKTLIERLIATLGQDDANIRIVGTGVLAAQQLRLGYGLDEAMAREPNSPAALLSGGDISEITKAGADGATTLGWLVNNGYGGAQAKADLQAKQAQVLSNILSTAAGLPGIPKPKGPWTGWALDQAQSAALDAAGKAPEDGSGASYDKLEGDSLTSMQRNVLNTMLDHGYLDPEDYEAGNKRLGSGNANVPPPQSAIRTDPTTGVRSFDFDDPEFQKWQDNHLPVDLLNDTVVTPYGAVWPKVGSGGS